MSASSSDKINLIISFLFRIYGDIDWWKAESADEIIIGAILTQATRWENVERSLDVLKEQNLCRISSIYSSDTETIEAAVKSSGFYRQKTARLKACASCIMEEFGGVETLSGHETVLLRDRFLSVKGIGEETADSILCYALDRPSFVIDAYTKKICTCAGITGNYGDLKRLFEEVIPACAGTYRQVHAHLVEYAKGYCQKRRCQECWIRSLNV
jgi:endonuclease-3 related protein